MNIPQHMICHTHPVRCTGQTPIGVLVREPVRAEVQAFTGDSCPMVHPLCWYPLRSSRTCDCCGSERYIMIKPDTCMADELVCASAGPAVQAGNVLIFGVRVRDAAAVWAAPLRGRFAQPPHGRVPDPRHRPGLIMRLPGRPHMPACAGTWGASRHMAAFPAAGLA